MIVILPLSRLVEGEAPLRVRFNRLFGVKPGIIGVRRVGVGCRPMSFLIYVLKYNGVPRSNFHGFWVKPFVGYVYRDATLVIFMGNRRICVNQKRNNGCTSEET